MRTLKILHKATATLDTYPRFIRLCAITHPKLSPFAAQSANTRAVLKVCSHFEYLAKRLRGLDVTWQSVRGDLTVHPCTVILSWG
jgi:hypothetical protein